MPYSFSILVVCASKVVIEEESAGFALEPLGLPERHSDGEVWNSWSWKTSWLS